MKILGLIPARGGSKGVPRKNIKPLGGRPLIEYSIEAGLQCPLIDHLMVSTDDEEIAAVSRDAGADVPFLRPSALASDQSPTIDTVIHTLQYFIAQGQTFDAVCLLQPTVPFRSAQSLEEAIQRFEEQQAESLFSVRKIPHTYHPYWAFMENPATGWLHGVQQDGVIIPRRQSLPTAYHRDGSIYLTRSEVVLERHSLYGDKIAYYLNEAAPDINIDTLEDWKKAEDYIATQTID